MFRHVADEGLMNACAGSLMRYRKQLGIDDRVAVFTDIKVTLVRLSRVIVNSCHVLKELMNTQADHPA